MDFLFASEERCDYTTLQQGDLLIKNESLSAVIRQAHPYYADAEDYTHFLVLTQSCDLVRRNGKSKPKSPYITLCAVRPFSILLERQLPKFSIRSIDGIQICDKASEASAQQFLERMLHNTFDGIFFMRKESHSSITEDLCAFLALSVALRAEHYDSCVAAKVAQLDDIFAAKIGWSVGNMYSRVGTPDIEEHMSEADDYKSRFYEEALNSKAIWLSNIQYKQFAAELKKWQKANRGKEADFNQLLEIARNAGNDMDYIAERIIESLENNEIISLDPEAKEKAKNVIRNDDGLISILKKAWLHDRK
jgi:hypothetical protein